jgi:catechol 2,3-dioxygenase-like lactoylglutathione lyase family enzyme
MQLRHVIIKVDDQDKALDFYTNVLGFKKRTDDRGPRMRRLTVASTKGATGVELVLESSSPAPARKAQRALYDAVYPAAIVSTNNIDRDYERLRRLGVKFRGKPRQMGANRFAFFDDTCGNYIVLMSSVTSGSPRRRAS